MHETAAAFAAQEPQPIRAPRLLADILSDLKKHPAPKHLRTKTKGNREIPFIPWYFAIQYLDLYAPGWSYEIRSVTPLGDKVVLTVRLSVPTSDHGVIYREASGIEDEETPAYGDPSSNAESMALRRAAAKFGFGLFLYDNK